MIFNADTATQQTKVSNYLKGNIQGAPHVYVQISTLGGATRAAAMIKISLDPKAKWANGIFQNSRYFMLHLGRNGVLEQFAKSYRIPNKLRKSTVKSLADAVLKINKYIRANK